MSSEIPDLVLKGPSQVAEILRHQVEAAATSAVNILLKGESGVGKTCLARHIHHHSRRRVHPFAVVSCDALPEPVLLSELFGHEAGSFEGAYRRKVGLVRQADRGTVALRGLARVGTRVQLHLLRLATSGEVWPIGAPPGRAGNPPAHSSVRLIGIADEDLTKTLEAGTFSRELVHRLAAVEISVPPVRDRADDIPVLFEQCLVDAGRVHSRPAPQLSADAEACARQYHWPGNIRELRRIAELLAKRSFGGRLSETDLRAALDPGSRPPGRDG